MNSELFSEIKSFLLERINRNCILVIILIAIVILFQYKNEKNFNKLHNDIKINTNKLYHLFSESK